MSKIEELLEKKNPTENERKEIARGYDKWHRTWLRELCIKSERTVSRLKTVKMNRLEIAELQQTYGATEAYLKACGFNAKHLFRDARGDWGDDSGFIVAVSEKNNIWYAHFIFVSYNGDCKYLVLEESDYKNSGTRDFKSFKTYNEAINYVKRIADFIYEIATSDNEELEYINEYGHASYADEVKKEYANIAPFNKMSDEDLIHTLNVIGAFFDYPRENYCRMKYIELVEYKEHFQMYGEDIKYSSYDDDFLIEV